MGARHGARRCAGRADRPHSEDLETGGDAMGGVMVWRATRLALSFTQRATGTGTEAVLDLEG